MKKKLKITIIIGAIILLFAIITGIVDNGRIKDNKQPIFTIKINNGEIGKITYWGMGYKVIGYWGISINEPFDNNIGLKFGSWFMNYEMPNDENEKQLKDEEHSFFGNVVESHKTYLIVEPKEYEEERKSSDKFHINIDENNDENYKKGIDVKITYVGGINETYPAQIDTTKIELESVVKDNVLKKINSIAESGPLTSSNPYDYINANKKIYEELLANPKETFLFAFSDLIQNNKNGLTNYIEAMLCSKINTNFKYNFATASDYLENYKEFLLKCDCIYNEYDIYAKSLLK